MLLALAGSATAADPVAPIIGGTVVKTCGWPTTVSIGGCTATLVHPEVILYAAHCGGGSKTVSFGSPKAGAQKVSTKSCKVNPAFNNSFGDGIDWAYCILEEPILDIPIVPILMGCEV